MPTINVKFNEKDYKVICSEIYYWYDVKIKPMQMKTILATADKYLLTYIADDIVNWNNMKNMRLSTSIREDIADLISKKLTNMNWPNYATSSKKYDIWLKKFVKGCKKYHYKCWDGYVYKRTQKELL